MKKGSRVGPFTLGPILGQGGMATVFIANHEMDDTPVALKILRPEIAKEPSYQEAFTHEVQSAARLDHQRITAVFDHGIVQATEDPSPDGFAGAPWLAMELVEGGTISNLVGRVAWPQLRRILLDVLDALAHAHARGMIHRDIKPANVLLDLETGHVKLTDFGLVHSADFGVDRANDPSLPLRGINENLVSGTPSYISPEQIRCHWRKYGPWTDLYSVGAMAWKIATGSAPYQGEISAVFQQHLRGNLPVFNPIFPMPSGFLEWIDVMMRVNPDHRFRRAADAAWALSQIEGTTLAVQAQSDDSTVFEQDTIQYGHSDDQLATLALGPDATTVYRTLEPELNEATGESERASQQYDSNQRVPDAVKQTPPLPTHWGPQRRARLHLNGAGLALFGLRATGVVGRTIERDTMWAALHTTIREQRSQLLLIDGAAGSGKSTLASWLCTRADEVGGGRWITATHTAERSRDDGIEPLLARYLKTRDRPRETLVQEVYAFLKDRGNTSLEDAVGLVQLARSVEETDEGTALEMHFSSPKEKHALIHRFIHAMALRRPLILWLDALHHSPESQALVQYMLTAPAQSPVLILATSQAEEVVEGSEVDERIQALLTHPCAQKIRLKPLDREGQTRLIKELLGLDPGLAARVEARAGGNPQFAVQLMADWVHRGLLNPGPQGFQLSPGSDESIPKDMLGIWTGRLETVLGKHSEKAAHAIELGAILGNEVKHGEWLAALDAARLSQPTELLAELTRLRLIVAHPQSRDWSFVHGLLRAAVLERIDHHGRRSQWSSLCADILPTKSYTVARKARLLVAANRTEEALIPLKDAVAEEITLGEYGRARDLADLRNSILKNFPVEPDGIHALSTEITHVYLADLKTRKALLNSRGELLVEWAERLEEWDAMSQMRLSLAGTVLIDGDNEKAKRMYIEALDIAQRHNLPREVEILNRLCFYCIRTGDISGAVEYARQAALAAESQGDTVGVGNAYTMLSRVNRQIEQFDIAEFYLNEAEIRFEKTGCRRGLAEVWNTRGELARSSGDLKAAEEAYVEASIRYESCASDLTKFALLNLGMTYLEGKKFNQAKSILTKVEKGLGGGKSPAVLLILQLTQTLCFIHEQDWDRVEHNLSHIGPGIAQVGIIDTDVVGCARMAALACEEAGKMDLARKAWSIAHRQLEALGRTEEAQEAARRSGISSPA